MKKRKYVTGKTRTLSAKWTIERVEDIEPYHGIDTQDEIRKILSQEIANAIDQEIIQDIRDHQERDELMIKGWVKAPFTTEKFKHDSLNNIQDVAAWIHLNATGEYRIFGREFWFQRQRDLTAFILRWS